MNLGRIKMVKKFLSVFVFAAMIVSMAGADALHKAAKKNDVKKLQKLIAAGEDVNDWK